MATAIKVIAEARTSQGTSQARRLRRDGKIPGIVYGVGKTPQNVQVNARDFTRSLHAQSSEHVMMDLEIGAGDLRKVLLQDVQHHPVSGDIIHADFHEISLTEKLRVKVPVQGVIPCADLARSAANCLAEGADHAGRLAEFDGAPIPKILYPAAPGRAQCQSALEWRWHSQFVQAPAAPGRVQWPAR